MKRFFTILFLSAFTAMLNAQIEGIGSIGGVGVIPVVFGGSLIFTNNATLVLGGGNASMSSNNFLGGSTTGRSVVIRAQNVWPSQTSVNNAYVTRLPGTVYAAYINIGGVGQFHGIKFKVFRWNQNTNTTLDLVGESELITSLSVGSNYFVLAQPIGGVRESDLPGLYLTNGNPQTIVSSTNIAGVTSFYASGDAVGTANTINTGAGAVPDFALYMNAPVISWTGDSIFAGHNCSGENGYNLGTNYWQPFLDNATFFIAGRLASSIAYTASTNQESLVTYGNYSKGGTDYQWVNTNAMAYILKDHALVLALQSGINDVFNGEPWSEALTNLNSIRAQWPTTNPFAIGEIMPYTGASDAVALNIRTWNTNLALWCATQNVTLIIQHNLMGTNRVSTGQLDDMLPAYSSTVPPHLSTTGIQTLVSNWNAQFFSKVITTP